MIDIAGRDRHDERMLLCLWGLKEIRMVKVSGSSIWQARVIDFLRR